MRMFGGIAARCGRRAERTLPYSDRADRLKPNIVFSKRDSYQRRGHLTVCKVAFFRLTLPRTGLSRPRIARKVDLARKRVQVADRGFSGLFFWHVAIKHVVRETTINYAKSWFVRALQHNARAARRHPAASFRQFRGLSRVPSPLRCPKATSPGTRLAYPLFSLTL